MNTLYAGIQYVVYVVLFIIVSQVCDTQAQTVSTIIGPGGIPYVVYQDDRYSIDGSQIMTQSPQRRRVTVYGNTVSPGHSQDVYIIEQLSDDAAIVYDATSDDSE